MSRQKFSRVEEAEQNLKITQIADIFENITRKIKFSGGTDIVAFIGPTKAGKSTLINCLMNNPLLCKVDPNTEETWLVAEKPAYGPAIGLKGESQTSIPAKYGTLPGTDWPMWDFPGFCDNKGTDQEIANAAAYERVLRPQRSVRFVLVVPIDMIKSDDPMRFFQLLSNILLVCPNVTENFCLIATKSEKGFVKAWLESVLKATFSKTDKENAKIVKDAKFVIQEVLMNGRCIDLKAPDVKWSNKRYLPPNLPNIINLIKDIDGAEVGDFPLIISDKAKHEVLELYTVLYETLRRDVEQICKQIDGHFQRKIDEVVQSSITSEARLALFKKGQSVITSILKNSKDFESFFAEIKNYGFLVDSLDQRVNNFIFVEDVKNMYKLKEDQERQGKEMFFKRVLLVLTSVANKYSDLIQNSEAATAEEKRKEKALKEAHERDMKGLKDQVEKLELSNAKEKERLADYERKNRNLEKDVKKLLRKTEEDQEWRDSLQEQNEELEEQLDRLNRQLDRKEKEVSKQGNSSFSTPPPPFSSASPSTQNTTGTPNTRALNFGCDSCKTIISGDIYHCTDCYNYDLCSYCRSMGVHTGHNFLVFRNEWITWSDGRKTWLESITKTNPFISMTHTRARCDICQKSPIIGKRFKCRQCYNYDLCSNCHQSGYHSEHLMYGY